MEIFGRTVDVSDINFRISVFIIAAAIVCAGFLVSGIFFKKSKVLFASIFMLIICTLTFFLHGENNFSIVYAPAEELAPAPGELLVAFFVLLFINYLGYLASLLRDMLYSKSGAAGADGYSVKAPARVIVSFVINLGLSAVFLLLFGSLFQASVSPRGFMVMILFPAFEMTVVFSKKSKNAFRRFIESYGDDEDE